MGEEQAKQAEGKPDSDKPGEEKPAESAWTGLLKEAAKTLMPVLLTGASLIGFVAFAGAVIVWTRFEAIGVPSDQAVKAVPQDELVATGSSFLLLFGFFGLLAVLATYLVDRGGRATPGMSRALLLLVAIEGVIAIVLIEDVQILTRMCIGLGFLVLVGLALLATFDRRFATYDDVLAPRDGETEKPVRGPDSLHTRRGELRLSVWIPILILLLVAALATLAAVIVFKPPEDLWRFVVWLLVAVCSVALLIFLLGAWKDIEASRSHEEWCEKVEKEAEKIKEEEEEAGLKGRFKRLRGRVEKLRNPESGGGIAESKETKRLSKRRPHRLVLRFWGVCALLVLAAAAIAAPAVILHQGWLAASFGAAFILAAGVWRVAVLSKPTFMWYGLVVFLSVPLFGTCTLMVRNVADPQVQPMAMIRSSDGPGESIQGIYVTEGSDRVYFANVATEGCENEVTPDSGRLLWVPKSEVVAMSVGPLQDVDEAGLSALEMSYALTPDVETPTGAHVSLAVEEKPDESQEAKDAASQTGESSTDQARDAGDGEKTTDEAPGDDSEKSEGEEESGSKEEESASKEDEEGEAEAAPAGHRLESAGPAVRPNFGEGLKLVPPNAEPGDVVELRMSVPNREVDGFGLTPSGYNLRLNGVRLAILRVPARKASRAEYAKTKDGTVLSLGEVFHGKGATKGGWFTRLEKDSVTEVLDGSPRNGLSLKLGPDGTLAPREIDEVTGEPVPPSVILANGEEEELRNGLLRRAWSPTRIKFRVPENAQTGVVSVECGQLAGQPVLTVVHPPVAHISVKMRPGSERITFDSSHSVEEGEVSRRWTIAGRRMGDKQEVSPALPTRLSPYLVSLTMTDSHGLSDTVELRVLRLPYSQFPFGSKEPESRKRDVRRVRKALNAAVDEEKPSAIELDGHADAVGGVKGNLKLSMERAERLRELVFRSAEVEPKSKDDRRLVNESAKVPMVVRAFGESCPIIRTADPEALNRRVEVFFLGPGSTVATGKGCRSDRIKRTSW